MKEVGETGLGGGMVGDAIMEKRLNNGDPVADRCESSAFEVG